MLAGEAVVGTDVDDELFFLHDATKSMINATKIKLKFLKGYFFFID